MGNIKKMLFDCLFGQLWKEKLSELQQIHRGNLQELKEKKINFQEEMATARNLLSQEKASFLAEMAATMNTELEILREFRGKEFAEKVEQWSKINISNSTIANVNQTKQDAKPKPKEDNTRTDSS